MISGDTYQSQVVVVVPEVCACTREIADTAARVPMKMARKSNISFSDLDAGRRDAVCELPVGMGFYAIRCQLRRQETSTA